MLNCYEIIAKLPMNRKEVSVPYQLLRLMLASEPETFMAFSAFVPFLFAETYILVHIDLASLSIFSYFSEHGSCSETQKFSI
jgi:hypothetical protein